MKDDWSYFFKSRGCFVTFAEISPKNQIIVRGIYPPTLGPGSESPNGRKKSNFAARMRLVGPCGCRSTVTGAGG
jgi:hypothetical protein